MKTPEEMAEEYAQAYIESDSYLCSKYSFLAGYKAGREMSNKEIFDEYIRLREKHQATVMERIKIKVLGIFG